MIFSLVFLTGGLLQALPVDICKSSDDRFLLKCEVRKLQWEFARDVPDHREYLKKTIKISASISTENGQNLSTKQRKTYKTDALECPMIVQVEEVYAWPTLMSCQNHNLDIQSFCGEESHQLTSQNLLTRRIVVGSLRPSCDLNPSDENSESVSEQSISKDLFDEEVMSAISTVGDEMKNLEQHISQWVEQLSMAYRERQNSQLKVIYSNGLSLLLERLRPLDQSIITAQKLLSSRIKQQTNQEHVSLWDLQNGLVAQQIDHTQIKRRSSHWPNISGRLSERIFSYYQLISQSSQRPSPSSLTLASDIFLGFEDVRKIIEQMRVELYNSWMSLNLGFLGNSLLTQDAVETVHRVRKILEPLND